MATWAVHDGHDHAGGSGHTPPPRSLPPSLPLHLPRNTLHQVRRKRPAGDDDLFEEGQSEFQHSGIPAYVPGPVPRASHVQTHLSPTTTSEAGLQSHLTHQDAEAQRVQVPCPRSHSQETFKRTFPSMLLVFTATGHGRLLCKLGGSRPQEAPCILKSNFLPPDIHFLWLHDNLPPAQWLNITGTSLSPGWCGSGARRGAAGFSDKASTG